MKDLKSYFQSKVLAASLDSHNISEDANSSFIVNTKKKRQYDPLSDNSAPTQPKRKTCKLPKSSKNTNINLNSTDDDSCEYDSSKKSKIRKKLRKKLPIAKNRCDSSPSSSNRVDTSTASTPKEIHTPALRVFKNVVIENCMNSSSVGSVQNETLDKGVISRRRKRRKNKVDYSEFEESDSSGNLFEKRSSEQQKLPSNRSATREIKEENSLLKYFAKAEKPLVSDDKKLQNSPIDCLKRVNVVVEVHSPPKTLSNKAKRVNRTKTRLSPVVQLFRTDTIKPLNLDTIEVIKSEPTKSEPLSAGSIQNKADDQDSDTSIILSNNKRPKVFLKKLVLDDSESESVSQTCKSRKSTNLKTKKSVSFSRLRDSGPKSKSPVETDYTSSHSKSSDCEDSIWKMRVQFIPKAKLEEKPKKSKSKNKGERSNSSEDETVIKNAKKVENEIRKETNDSKSKSENKSEIIPSKPQKLAPLFCKPCKNGKKKTNGVINYDDEARKLFLGSGLPDVVKKKFEEQKTTAVEEESYTCYKFPIFNHVQQKSENFVWNLPNTEITLKMIEKSATIPNCDSHSSYIGKDVKSVTCKYTESDFDLKNEVAALKKVESGVNVTDIYGSIRRLNQEAESINDICWTDKYKPSRIDDLIGNVLSLTKLKEWIESHKRLKIVHSDRDSSSEEFFDSDDSSCDSRKDNVAILVGPSGCGKTCSVYMLAKELGFEVLEVNAGSNRSGKRLLDELMEATQSHQVKRTTIFDKAVRDKKSKRKKKKKLKEDQQDRKTRSLILIEDADILFEDHDEGFLSALSTLAKQSKRPLVFIVNDINYPHLSKYRNNLILPFEYPSRSLINVWLRLIALSEGVKLPDAVLVDLFHVAGQDVRKSLLQLQMLVSSRLSHSNLDSANLFYQDWCQRLAQINKLHQLERPLPKIEVEDPIDDLFSPKKQIVNVECGDQNNEEIRRCKISEIDRIANQSSLENHAKLFTDIAMLGHFESNQKEHIHLCERTSAPCEDSLGADIRASLEQLLFSSYENSNRSPVSFTEYYSLIRKNYNIRSVYQNALSNLKIPLNDGYAKYCDFLPALRNITRIEESKQINQVKRTSRFFSYLKSVNICVSDREIEFLRKSMI